MSYGTDHEYLYRVLRPEENPDKGLKASDRFSDTSIEDHVAYGTKITSKYISTCASKTTAKRFAQLGLDHGDPSPKTIVKLDVAELEDIPTVKIIDLTKSSVRRKHLGSNERAHRFAMAWEEVLIKGKVPKYCIVKEYQIHDD